MNLKFNLTNKIKHGNIQMEVMLRGQDNSCRSEKGASLQHNWTM